MFSSNLDGPLVITNNTLQGSRAPLAGQLYDEGGCPPCRAGYYQLRGGGLGTLHLCFIETDGTPHRPAQPAAAAPHQRRGRDPLGVASTFSYTKPELPMNPEHLQLWVACTFTGRFPEHRQLHSKPTQNTFNVDCLHLTWLVRVTFSWVCSAYIFCLDCLVLV